MPHVVKRIARSTTAKLNNYAGPAGELFMDTATNDLVLQNGQAGGVRLAKAATAITADNGLSVTAGGTLAATTTVSGVDATTAAKGVVQLSNATDGTSQTMAATPKAVSDALQAAKDYADTAGAPYSGTAPIAVDATNRVISVTDATTSAKGAVQLSNAMDGTSQTMAATSKAVSDALQAAKDYADTVGAPYSGTAPINVNSSTRVISVTDATTAAKGVVQLSNATAGTSQTTAATEKAVADALQAAKDYTDAAGKAAMAHAAMPSEQYIALTLPASRTVMAPADGFISLLGSSLSGAIAFVRLDNSTKVISSTSTVSYQGYGIAVTIPVSSGDTILVRYDRVQNIRLYFTYANGTAPTNP